jgi:drug/metabolite transporter (DMT)-like permease
VILGRRLAHLPPLGVIGTALRLTAVAYVPVVVLSGPGESPSATAIDSVVALAVVCTALAFILFFVLIAEIGPMRATASRTSIRRSPCC